MQETPLVSICCITYNHAPFIRKCLDGFLMQKVDFPIEILIHDDCSTDGTTDIIKEYAAKYPELIFPLYEEENKYSNGYKWKMDLFNYERVKGKYVAYCEGDDYWTEPTKLQRQVDFLESHPDYSVCWHRCKHSNIDGSLIDDKCSLLFQNNENGVDISISTFFKYWVTQPMTMVFRCSKHDNNLAHYYQHYRDTYEIFHLLKEGKGYLMNFYGGIRNIHYGGISSMNSNYEACIFELESADELFYYNRNDDVRQYWRTTVLWSLVQFNGFMYFNLIMHELSLFNIEFVKVYLVHQKRKIKQLLIKKHVF